MARAKRPAPSRRSVAFGAFRATPATTWRPVMRKFDPKFATSEGILDDLRAIERLDHDLSRQPRLAGGLAERLRRETLARNAFATASIEGNPLTLPDVETLLAAAPAGGRRGRSTDELEILNYAEVMTSRRAQRAPRELADVLDVHARLFRGVLKDAGEWKRTMNFIGSAATRTVVYVAAKPERVGPELENALAWLHDARSVHPVVRALLFHHEFESIHPFRDGNGRAGRALTPMILHELGYPGSALAPIDFVIHERRGEYYANLAVVERNGFTDHSPWLAFLARVVRDAYERALVGALFERGLPQGLPTRQREVAAWFAQLRQHDPRKRVKFADVQRAFPAVAERTLKRDLTQLRDAGVLDVQGALKGTSYALAVK